ncbi:hypothetical protein AN963_29235 [Brevibacillus choshinensis]|uniref:Uncharacterized protein n=1 Tax=Brevibacillus choshinensis TaxID=54911 RepID=A0ABR5MZQ4_BRECH|nr:hypothetical protein [Brevibacillus choshinensis]KQL43532.1 hypothetical protein AN963_29235 [Brevibacillus choshinensis]
MGGVKEERWEQSMADAYRQLESLVAKRESQGEEQGEPCTEKQLFALLTQVYLNEEEVRVRQKLKRKSSQRISRVMHEKVGNFLAQRLTDYEFLAMEGLLFAKKDGKVVAVLKCIPDLGSYDTHSWNATIARFAKQYQKRYQLATEQLLFVICSLSKSLDAAHAKALTGIEVWSGTALTAPAYREALQAYVCKCVETMEALPAPAQQIYFLSADIHPNALACQLIQGEATSLPDRWLRPSVSELIQYLDSRL